jgi:hypothetical protein
VIWSARRARRQIESQAGLPRSPRGRRLAGAAAVAYSLDSVRVCFRCHVPHMIWCCNRGSACLCATDCHMPRCQSFQVEISGRAPRALDLTTSVTSVLTKVRWGFCRRHLCLPQSWFWWVSRDRRSGRSPLSVHAAARAAPQLRVLLPMLDRGVAPALISVRFAAAPLFRFPAVPFVAAELGSETLVYLFGEDLIYRRATNAKIFCRQKI